MINLNMYLGDKLLKSNYLLKLKIYGERHLRLPCNRPSLMYNYLASTQQEIRGNSWLKLLHQGFAVLRYVFWKLIETNLTFLLLLLLFASNNFLHNCHTLAKAPLLFFSYVIQFLSTVIATVHHYSGCPPL